jgi:hypothetical protein
MQQATSGKAITRFAARRLNMKSTGAALAPRAGMR